MWLRGKLRGLNGWQRIGVVLSLVWALGAAIYQRNVEIDQSERFANRVYQQCIRSDLTRSGHDLDGCLTDFEKNEKGWRAGSWGNVAFVSLVPIPLLWGLGYLMIIVGRWVGAGFNKHH